MPTPSSGYQLPADIAESHNNLTALLKMCATLPFYDVARTLRGASEQERAKGFHAWAAFVDRLPTYITQHLDREKQEKLNAHDGLLASLRSALRSAERRPENWPFWGVSDRPRVELRQHALIEQLSLVTQDDKTAAVTENRKALTRIDCILTALSDLEKSDGLAVNASQIDSMTPAFLLGAETALRICPLTGLSTGGHATVETTEDLILYHFKPIGKALFDKATLEALNETAGIRPATDWAGICREADELGHKVPIFAGTPKGYSGTIPETFNDKRIRFLHLFYESGGKEHKSRDLFIGYDFPMAFAQNAEEFSRILDSLIEDGLLRRDISNDTPNDWPNGVRTHYSNVRLTSSGKKIIVSEPMADVNKRKINTKSSTMKSFLNIIKEEFSKKLNTRISSGKNLLFAFKRDASNENFATIEKNYKKWDSYNNEWLKHSFDNPDSSYAQGYDNAGTWISAALTAASRGANPDSLQFRINFFEQRVEAKIEYLEDLLGRLELIPYTQELTAKLAAEEEQAARLLQERTSAFLLYLYEHRGEEGSGITVDTNKDFSMAGTEQPSDFGNVLEHAYDNKLISYESQVSPSYVDAYFDNKHYHEGVILTPKGFKHLAPALKTNEENMSNTVQKMDKIFISHASADLKIVNEIIDLLEAAGVESGKIFCTSVQGHGIPFGENFLQRIKDELNGNVLVVFVLTANFYNSPICLCEMGAAWVRTSIHIPIVVPPFAFKDISGVIPLTQALVVNDNTGWSLLKEQIERWLSIQNPPNAGTWEGKRDRIIGRMNSILQ